MNDYNFTILQSPTALLQFDLKKRECRESPPHKTVYNTYLVIQLPINNWRMALRPNFQMLVTRIKNWSFHTVGCINTHLLLKVDDYILAPNWYRQPRRNTNLRSKRQVHKRTSYTTSYNAHLHFHQRLSKLQQTRSELKLFIRFIIGLPASNCNSEGLLRYLHLVSVCPWHLHLHHHYQATNHMSHMTRRGERLAILCL